MKKSNFNDDLGSTEEITLAVKLIFHKYSSRIKTTRFRLSMIIMYELSTPLQKKITRQEFPPW